MPKTREALSGLVTDASGAALRHAHVFVRNTATNKISQSETSADGQYTVPLLQADSYEVTATSDGFEREVHTGIILEVDQQGRSNFSLKVGFTSQTVEINTTPPLTSTGNSEVGTVINNRKVVGLPLNNRQFYSLALLAPGAYPPAQNSGLGYCGGLNVVGMPEVTNNFSVNGIDDSDEIANAPAFRPSIEGIQEFKLQTGTYGAEYRVPFGHGQRLLSSGLPVQLAGGWQLSGIFTAQTGTPFTPYYSSNNSGSFNLADRPNIVGDPNKGPRTVNAWFNTAAFAAAPLGNFGTAGRNVITGPGYVDVDAAITRTFPIHENVAFQFRAEGFNLANHPNFYNPTGNFATTSFDKITVANDPRQLQFAAKLLF